VVPDTIGRFTVGNEGTLTSSLRTLCCSHILVEGTKIRIYKRHSPKRVIIEVLFSPDNPYKGQLHKIKASWIRWNCLPKRLFEPDSRPEEGIL